MNAILEDMFKEFEFNDKPEELITEVNGIKLPEDYLGFMSKPTVSGGHDPAWGGFENTEYLSIVLNG